MRCHVCISLLTIVHPTSRRGSCRVSMYLDEEGGLAVVLYASSCIYPQPEDQSYEETVPEEYLVFPQEAEDAGYGAARV